MQKVRARVEDAAAAHWSVAGGRNTGSACRRLLVRRCLTALLYRLECRRWSGWARESANKCRVLIVVLEVSLVRLNAFRAVRFLVVAFGLAHPVLAIIILMPIATP